MTPPRTLLGILAAIPPWRRRVAFGLALAVLAVLCVVPRKHVATVQLTQPTGNASGLGALLSQLGGGGGYSGLLGGGQPYEVSLAVARSFAVETAVLRRAGLLGTPGYEDVDAGVRRLRRHVDVVSLRGAIVEIDVQARDPGFALRVAQTYAEVFRTRLTAMGRAQTAFKRGVLEDRLRGAAERLSAAQAAVDRFRAGNALPDLGGQLAASVGALGGLEAQLQAARARLEAAQRFATPDNYEVRRLGATVAALERQVAVARRGRGDGTAAGLAAKSNRYADLQRDLAYAQSLYAAYTRSLETATVEDESAAWSVQALQPAYLRPGIHPNLVPLGLLILAALLGAGCELYVAAPRRRP